jgi:NAD(P)H-hydrate epimerase
MGCLVLQTAVPEAMFSAGSRAQVWAEVPSDLERYDAVGIGPGIGQAPETADALGKTLAQCERPVVLDADALNVLAKNTAFWHMVPKGSILTPHVGEFERLFGTCANSYQRNELQRAKAREHGVVLVLKGAYTAVALPDGRCFYNSTGNPGMATGGTGDVLTGILTALLAQGYTPEDAAVLGVYLHGLAGDLAAQETGEEGLTAGDVAAFLGKAFLRLAP